MSTENQQLATTEQSSMSKFRGLLDRDEIKKKFNEALGKKATLFMSGLVTIMSGSAELQKCEHMSIISSALMAASMDLPLTPGLGFAGIVPYWDSATGTMKAQFQIMKKGYIQLAQRTGLFKIINVCEVFEGELTSFNRFTGEYTFDNSAKKSDTIIGYVSYFKLVNGFEKYLYMPIEKLDAHARKYSKSFQKGKGKWADKEQGGYEQMCEKTVLKLNLSTYAPLSVDINMMNAIIYDQAEIRDIDGKDFDYMDNEESKPREDKDVITTKGGAQIVINKQDQQRSAKITDKAREKVDQKNFTDVSGVVSGGGAGIKATDKDESPFIPQKGSVETFDGTITRVNGELTDQGSQLLNISDMEKMPTEDLLKIVNADQDMIEALTIIPGKNTNKKLREIIDAHQRGKLADHVAKNMPKEEPKEADQAGQQQEETFVDPLSGEVISKEQAMRNLEKGQPAELIHPKSEELNKYSINIPAFNKGNERDFPATKELYNALSKVSPAINNERFLALQAQIPEFGSFKNKEDFAKYATIEQVNHLLNANN
jgi:recombination protein RecT